MSAKHVLEQFIVVAGGITQTADVTIGYHPGKEQWWLFGRVRIPENYIDYPDNLPDRKGTDIRSDHREGLCFKFEWHMPDFKGDILQLFDPGPNKELYYAAIEELEPSSVSNVMLYQWIPILIKKDGKIQRHDYNTYKAMLHLDMGGLSRIMDRLKGEDVEVDEGSAKGSEQGR
ncbi:hypothetical protein BJY00DRAFT_311053 [Aspergillus carlsbadensis]|nr:hypothetical protein BJY00DRAFT_311053 [Aspergillus carlsbadensis]